MGGKKIPEKRKRKKNNVALVISFANFFPLNFMAKRRIKVKVSGMFYG